MNFSRILENDSVPQLNLAKSQELKEIQKEKNGQSGFLQIVIILFLSPQWAPCAPCRRVPRLRLYAVPPSVVEDHHDALCSPLLPLPQTLAPLPSLRRRHLSPSYPLFFLPDRDRGKSLHGRRRTRPLRAPRPCPGGFPGRALSLPHLGASSSVLCFSGTSVPKRALERRARPPSTSPLVHASPSHCAMSRRSATTPTTTKRKESSRGSPHTPTPSTTSTTYARGKRQGRR